MAKPPNHTLTNHGPKTPSPAPRVRTSAIGLPLPVVEGLTGHTKSDDRNSRFTEKFNMWKIFHDDRGRTVYTKAMLEELFYGDHVEREAWWQDQVDRAATPEARAAVIKNKNKEKDSRRQHIGRLVAALQGIKVPITELDERHRRVDPEDRPQKTKDGKSIERQWRYDPDGEWAKKLDELLDTHGIHGYELVGIMACRSLLADLVGLPQLEGVRGLVDKMTDLLPPEIYEDALEEARAWRYSLGSTTKYASPEKKAALAQWHQATIYRRQVEIEHQTPGKEVRTRRLAALGTTFDREENAIYLIGSEEDPEKPGTWKWPLQWKLDRVSAVRPLDHPNPPLAALGSHRRVRRADGPGPERLDIAHLFSDSVGSFFRYGEPTIRLEVLVHTPRWMAWCTERPFHPKQRVAHEIDATGAPVLRLVVDRCDEEEIASRLLRLGDDFTVVSPPSLIEKLKTTAAAILRRHA